MVGGGELPEAALSNVLGGRADVQPSTPCAVDPERGTFTLPCNLPHRCSFLGNFGLEAGRRTLSPSA
jgi:hypothetical protein